MGYGFVDEIMYIAIPMVGGGMKAGVVLLSGMYAQALNVDASGIISHMIPASTLGNVSAIIGARMLVKLGDVSPFLTGNGKLMRKNDEDLSEVKKPAESIKLMVNVCHFFGWQNTISGNAVMGTYYLLIGEDIWKLEAALIFEEQLLYMVEKLIFLLWIRIKIAIFKEKW